MSLQLKKKKKKAKKKNAIKIILPTDEETEKEEDIDEEDVDEEEDEGGMYMDKEDVQLIYNALKNYKPAEKEIALYDTWLEMFEQTLVVDFRVKLPGFEDFFDEEEN
jgi:hypothetical protein